MLDSLSGEALEESEGDGEMGETRGCRVTELGVQLISVNNRGILKLLKCTEGGSEDRTNREAPVKL